MDKPTLIRAVGVLGFRVHSGWAAAIAVGGDGRAPKVVDRRRLELADRSISGSMQPFHACKGLELKAAEKLIQRCRESTAGLAESALRGMIEDLRKLDLEVAGACILLAAGRPVGTLESILASHATIHTAEGEFFRDAVKQGLGKCSVPVTTIKERDVYNQGSKVLGVPAEEIPQRAAEMGRALGPPWRQDEKLAAVAAWIGLAELPDLEKTRRA